MLLSLTQATHSMTVYLFLLQVWIVSAELMPDALAATPHPLVATATTLSAAWYVCEAALI